MTTPVHFLFVDNQHLILSALERAVRDERFVSYFTMDPAQAERLVRDHDVEVVVADYSPPHTNGLMLLQALGQARPRLVKALLAGDPGREALHDLQELGIAWLEKPWRLEPLKAQLRLLEQRALDARGAGAPGPR